MKNKYEVGLNVGRNGNSLITWIKYVASVHDEEQSKDTNDVSAEGCSELAKRKLELEEEELKPHVKKSKVSKKERKTKLEKSIAVLKVK